MSSSIGPSSDDKLTIHSTVTLSTGHKMPLLGFGVYQNKDATPSVIEAFRAGYRCMLTFGLFVVTEFPLWREDMSIQHRYTETRRRSPTRYANRGWTGERCSSVRLLLFQARCCDFNFDAATKCTSKTHGYDSTKKGVDVSLEKMKFGVLLRVFRHPSWLTLNHQTTSTYSSSTTLSPVLNVACKPTKPSWRPRKMERSGLLVFRISAYHFQ
jgi:hypothetical protein